MPFPNDLENVAVLKIHPAIGVARLSNNNDFYEFFEYEEKRDSGQAQDLEYMSKDDGVQMVKRQAVRFRIFAYNDNGEDLGELSPAVMSGLQITPNWSANVANRKLHNWTGTTPVVEANASAAPGERKRLNGANPWRPGENVWLGDITGDGMFIPPMGGAYRESDTTEIPPYGAHEQDNGILDTTSDGSISVELDGSDVPVLPACIIVAPQQHSPDVYPDDLGGNNKDFLKATRTLLNIPQGATLDGAGYAMDISMMRVINADYHPGMEICLIAGNSLPDPSDAFFPRGANFVDQNEIRPMYQAGQTEHGALTSGLCSAWQTDLEACLNWWTAEFPDRMLHDDDPKFRRLSRKDYDTDEPRMKHPEDLNAYIDRMGVGRDLQSNPRLVFETERDPANDPGDTPQPPYPIDANHDKIS